MMDAQAKDKKELQVLQCVKQNCINHLRLGRGCKFCNWLNNETHACRFGSAPMDWRL